MAVPILCYIKVVNLVFLSLRRAFHKVGGFLTVFIALLFGFAQAHCLVFKGSLYDFSTAGQSMFSLARSLLGDFDFLQLQELDSYMGPILFLVFVFLAIFVLMNMVIAIICDSYEETSEQMLHLPSHNVLEDLWEYIFEQKFVGAIPKKVIRFFWLMVACIQAVFFNLRSISWTTCISMHLMLLQWKLGPNTLKLRCQHI